MDEYKSRLSTYLSDMIREELEKYDGGYTDEWNDQRKKNAEVLGYKLSGTSDISEEITDWQGGYNDEFKFKKGQLIKDINPDCPHHGSEGEVTKVTKDEVTYTVRNNGKTYKVGDELTKTKEQLTPLSLDETINEKISKEEWAQYPAYARKLKPYMQRLLKVRLKVRVIKQANHNPWIEIRVARFGKDIIPNDFRKKAFKVIGGRNARDMDNINYGNIRTNSISMKHDQWVKLLGNKIKESINEVRWPDNQTSRLLAQAFKDARVRVSKVWEKGNHKYILRVRAIDGNVNVKMELNVVSNVITLDTQSGHVRLGELQPGSRGRKLSKNLKMLSKLPSFGVAGFKGLKYKIESILKEGGMGILDKDQTDVLHAIVMKNKNKNSKAILSIAMKDRMFRGVDKKELLGYIEGAKQFVRYMGRTGNESINEMPNFDRGTSGLPRGFIDDYNKIVKKLSKGKGWGTLSRSDKKKVWATLGKIYNESVKEERDYKAEYKKFQSSTKAKKYRAELNQYNRKKGTYGNNDGKDASHKGGKIAGFEKESTNRGRAEKSRLKKESVNEGKWSKIMRSVRKGSKAGPWSIVVYKNRKVKHQRLVKILQQIPAHYEDVKKKYPRDKIGIDDKYGERVYTESVNEDIGIETYLGGILKSMKKAGLKLKKAQVMKHGFSKSRDDIGFFIEVEKREIEGKKLWTLQLEVDRNGYLWYLSAPKDIKIGKWADTSQLVRGFKKLNMLPGFGQDAIFKRRR